MSNRTDFRIASGSPQVNDVLLLEWGTPVQWPDCPRCLVDGSRPYEGGTVDRLIRIGVPVERAIPLQTLRNRIGQQISEAFDFYRMDLDNVALEHFVQSQVPEPTQNSAIVPPDFYVVTEIIAVRDGQKVFLKTYNPDPGAPEYQLYFLIISLACMGGCYEKNLGPKADVTENGTGGFWKLSDYSVKGKSYPISSADIYSLVEIQNAIVKSEDSFQNSIFRVGVNYNIFSYNKKPGQPTISLKALNWDQTHNQSNNQDSQWFKIDDYTGFLVVLDLDQSTAISKKMQISNVIKSSEYKADLDTIRYTYIPTASWN